MQIRPLAADEIGLFARVCGGELCADSVEQYLRQMLEIGSIRLEWCFLALEDDRVIGTLAYWALPSRPQPGDFVLLTLPWERPDFLDLGSQLLRETRTLVDATEEPGYVLDHPPVKPQWQFFPEQRQQLLQHLGFRCKRQTLRIEWPFERSVPPVSERLTFRTLPEVGEAAFIAAIEQVSEGTFDQEIREER